PRAGDAARSLARPRPLPWRLGGPDVGARDREEPRPPPPSRAGRRGRGGAGAPGDRVARERGRARRRGPERGDETAGPPGARGGRRAVRRGAGPTLLRGALHPRDGRAGGGKREGDRVASPAREGGVPRAPERGIRR